MERVMEDRNSVLINNTAEHPYYREAEDEGPPKFVAEVIAPIVLEGDSIGAVVMGTKDKDVKLGDLERKLVEMAAGFLAKQMEQ